MDVYVVDEQGIRSAGPGDPVEVPPEGFIWVDIPTWDAAAEIVLRGLDCHPRVIEACAIRNHVPTVHSYPDHLFITSQSPLLGHAGHVHLLELDQIVGSHYLVTVHGPLNEVVDPADSLVETGAALERMRSGRFHPADPAELSYAITSAVARRQREMINQIAQKLPGLEKQVMGSRLTRPEELLERMFLIRHELITTRTMAAQCADVWARVANLERAGDAVRARARDLTDQFDRVRSIADGESQFLSGVIELYQTKVHTKMTVAMERLAVIAAVTLPITAIASIEGMNMIVAIDENRLELGIVLFIMVALSFTLLRWARRQGWW